ncbi:reticulon-like protein b9 [Phtheirospermum japonicum]|uniref:Reticulon-like protein n=1 Tax=Phtheirospermum japonicum TaxID=374723 RepID=A0A830C215_9LAMI|nr:reticulon-like protein b9 [Phtheirospermum japonicum]
MDNYAPPGKLFGRQRPIHAALGGGKVADVVLWRDPRVSAVVLIGIAAIWFLFEVVEYNLVTLLCHLIITTMLVLFIWSAAAEFLDWNPPNIGKIALQDSTAQYVASIIHRKCNQLLSNLLYVASGNDPKLFLMTIVSLWITSVIGSSINSLNLLFFGLLCLETLPFLYEKYEDEVDHLSYQVSRRMNKIYKMLDAEILEKIPRGPVKAKNN